LMMVAEQLPSTRMPVVVTAVAPACPNVTWSMETAPESHAMLAVPEGFPSAVKTANFSILEPLRRVMARAAVLLVALMM